MSRLAGTSTVLLVLCDVNGDTTADFELHFHVAALTFYLDDITM